MLRVRDFRSKMARYRRQSSRKILTARQAAAAGGQDGRVAGAVTAETNGRLETTVYPENNKLPGGDPDALKLLIAGEIQFFTLMGGIIGTVVPVAEAQQLPFAFKSAAEAHKAIDGPLGKYIGDEMAAKGMYLFPVAGFDNGMRQVASIPRPVAVPQDF